MYAHSNHIPQPPHSAGLGIKGLRPRIDSSQVPSPIEAIERDRLAWDSKEYMTLPGSHAPLSTSNFVAVDQGNSSPKFVRVSTWNVPSTSKLSSDSHLPIVGIFQPFAELDEQEEPVPLVDSKGQGPPRCRNCRAYINPWCSWTAGGVRWRCNLCSHETEVSADYFCNLDANLLRLDHQQRPELNKGTVDFVVTSLEEYWAQHPPQHISQPYYSTEGLRKGSKLPKPMDFVFAFDISESSVLSGFLQTACNALKAMLYGEGIREPCFPPLCRIAILTFDVAIHFYDFGSGTTRMLVVADIDEVFLPSHTVFVDPRDRKSSIESLLDNIPRQFSQNFYTDSCLGSAIQGSLAAFSGRGGHLILFHSSLPTIGAGALPRTPPAEASLYDTDKEKTLHTPRSIEWNSIAEECAEDGVGVSMFLAPGKYMDTGSVCVLATLTGGEVFWHPRFSPERDGDTMTEEFRRMLQRMQGYNCSVRVRCSHGLQPRHSYGAFLETSKTELTFAHLSADSAFSVEFEHTRNLSSREYAHLQCASLYTTVNGQRRVRVINMVLNIVDLAGSLFQYADMDAVVCHFAKEAMSSMSKQRTLVIREELTEKCASLLLGYRIQCAVATRSTQLIIPEAFRALPAFTLALQKTKPLKARQVSSDVRNYHIHRILSMSPRTLIHYLYPRLLALHDLNDSIALPFVNDVGNEVPNGVPDANGAVKLLMPSCMRNSHFYMQAGGIYLIDNEEMMIFWIGSSVSPQLLEDLFGVDDINSLDHHMHSLPNLQTRLSTQVHNILRRRFRERGRPVKMSIARQNLDASEIEFSDMLVEDQNNGAMSYMDYLATVHKQISNVLNNGGDVVSMRPTGGPW